MKKKYVAPEAEVINIEEDVIVTSTNNLYGRDHWFH